MAGICEKCNGVIYNIKKHEHGLEKVCSCEVKACKNCGHYLGVNQYCKEGHFAGTESVCSVWERKTWMEDKERVKIINNSRIVLNSLL